MEDAAGISPEAFEAAERELEQAQERAGVELRLIHDARTAAEASFLLDEVWNVGAAGTTVLEPSLLMALAHADNYVGAAVSRETGELIGVTVGFFSSPPEWTMHSHIAGVKHDEVGRGTGAAMKHHQRLWCLRRGITQMTWTFDPLIARNAYFNMGRLGARAVAYHEDFYGQMRDGVNAGQASDRLLVRWDLDRPGPASAPQLADAVPAVTIDEDGRPHELDVPREAALVSITIPSDIETLRGTDPALADVWRHALRRGITELLADGWEIAGFDRSGAYLFTHR